jgi:hypothetical protein
LQAAPDSEISSQYNQFCADLGNWSDRQFYDAENVLTAITAIDWDEESSMLLAKYLSAQHGVLINCYPESEGSMLQYLMHRHLHESIIVNAMYHDGIYPVIN